MTLFGGVISVSGAVYLIFSVFLVAAVGYLLGKITIKGVSLGTAGVFIIALLFGALFYHTLESNMVVSGTSYTKDALKIIETTGLALFVTSVGFIAGPNFFSNLKKNYKSFVLLGIIIILVGALTCVGCIFIGSNFTDLSKDEFTALQTGLLSGALTSTPAFSAAKATVGSGLEDFVTVGNGIAYIYGVIGVVLFVQIIPKIVKADIDKERALLQGNKKEDKQASGGGKKLIELDPFGLCVFSFAVVLGVILGGVKIPMGSASFSLTTTGGALICALILGHFGKIGRVSLTIDTRVLKVLRELGLMMFLIGAGISGGAKFIEVFQPVYLLYGALMTTLPMIVGFLVAKYVLKMSLFANLGSITGGMTSTPALGTLISTAKTDDVASAYAATYPIALLAVVLASQFIVMFC